MADFNQFLFTVGMIFCFMVVKARQMQHLIFINILLLYLLDLQKCCVPISFSSNTIYTYFVNKFIFPSFTF